ncbi:hypothetical protein T439DRAFT_359176 [Meredithblackwellia eburnea MCA 4105]
MIAVACKRRGEGGADWHRTPKSRRGPRRASTDPGCSLANADQLSQQQQIQRPTISVADRTTKELGSRPGFSSDSERRAEQVCALCPSDPWRQPFSSAEGSSAKLRRRSADDVAEQGFQPSTRRNFGTVPPSPILSNDSTLPLFQPFDSQADSSSSSSRSSSSSGTPHRRFDPWSPDLPTITPSPISEIPRDSDPYSPFGPPSSESSGPSHAFSGPTSSPWTRRWGNWTHDDVGRPAVPRSGREGMSQESENISHSIGGLRLDIGNRQSLPRAQEFWRANNEPRLPAAGFATASSPVVGGPTSAHGFAPVFTSPSATSARISPPLSFSSQRSGSTSLPTSPIPDTRLALGPAPPSYPRLSPIGSPRFTPLPPQNIPNSLVSPLTSPWSHTPATALNSPPSPPKQNIPPLPRTAPTSTTPDVLTVNHTYPIPAKSRPSPPASVLPNLPERSPWAMWVGNVPGDATEDELQKFLTRRVGLDPELNLNEEIVLGGIESIRLIGRSNCAFVNYNSQENLRNAIKTTNGVSLRPADRRSKPLLCRERMKEDDERSGVGAQRSGGLHRDYVKMKLGDTGIKEDLLGTSPESDDTTDSFLMEHFPKRYFILKAHSETDLQESVREGRWRTQAHNELILDQAFRTAKEGVFIVFSANKTGQWFGYGRMASFIEPVVEPSTSVPLVDEVTVSAGSGGTENIGKSSFRIEWIRVKSVGFSKTRHITNPFNSDREVKISRDGTEIEPEAGRKLLDEFWVVPPRSPNKPRRGGGPPRPRRQSDSSSS